MQGDGRILTFDQIESLYPDQWVLVEETDWNDDGEPVRGIVVGHARDRKDLVEPTRQLHTRNPAARTFVFYTGAKIPEGLTVVL